jgi:hypothetical protein
MDNKKSSEIKREEEEFYSAYTEYSKILRTWLVAYGIGGPVLFLTQSEISNKIIESGQARTIVYLFLLGVFFQIIISLINKCVNWYLYCHADPKTRKREWGYKIADWVSERFCIDILCDIGSIVAFGVATLKVLLIYTN